MAIVWSLFNKNTLTDLYIGHYAFMWEYMWPQKKMAQGNKIECGNFFLRKLEFINLENSETE